jgi:hypothetical protein
MDDLGWGPGPASADPDREVVSHPVELIGTQLRAAGVLRVAGFSRLSDYVNYLEGFFRIEDVVLRARNGEPTRVILPQLRIRLDDITIIGQSRPKSAAGVDGERVEKLPHRLVVMTTAHEIYGYAHLQKEASVTAFVDAAYPKFIPMTNVHVRWLADRRLAGRFDLALLQRSHIIGVATVTARASRPSQAGPTAGPAASPTGGLLGRTGLGR